MIARLTTLLIAVLVLAACGPDPTPTATPTPSGPTPTPAPLPSDTVMPRPPETVWLDLVARYRGVAPAPLSDETLYRNETVGKRTTFWVLDLDGPKMRQVDATLAHVSDAGLWYVADEINVPQNNLIDAANAFDDRILPTVLDLFAPALSLPGKITILSADIPGLAGYFSNADPLPAEAFDFSNERVMMVMNGDDVGSERYQGTLAHELQHLIQWHVDPTEETWVSEGLAEFAADSLDLPNLPFDAYFNNTEISFAAWPEDTGRSIPSYAASALFFAYLNSQRGLDAIASVVSQSSDGITGVANALGGEDQFAAFFGDWLAANVARATTGTYAYDDPPGAVRVPDLIAAPGIFDGVVQQLGATYVRIDPGNLPMQMRFEATTTTPLLPVPPRSGDRCWWANRGDSIDSTLTRSFDFRNVDAATLRFWTWYAIEDGFDRGYVAASTDNGATWAILSSERSNNENPIGTSLGASYTGSSNGWVEEQIDLSAYAGREVQLRFNYVTDESVNNTGWCIDDIAINGIGFTDDAEADVGWQANGFVRIHRDGIPQPWVLRTIAGTGDNAVVTAITLDGNNNATFAVDVPLVLAVGALTDQTAMPGTFVITASR